MTEARISLIRDYYRAFDTGSFFDSLHLFTEDCVVAWPADDALAEPTVLHGRSALSAFYRQVSDLSEPVHDMQSILVSGDMGAAEGVFTARVEGGEQISFKFAEYFTFRGDQIARRTTYFHRSWR